MRRAATPLAAGFLPALLLLAAAAFPARGAEQAPVRHEIAVTLDPAARTIAGRDRIVFPGTSPREAGGVVFHLHAGMSPAVEPPAVLTETIAGRVTAAYEVDLPAGVQEVTITWRGVIDHPLEQVGEEYARGQQETLGAITPEGVFLAPETHWYPRTPDDRVTFALDVELPAAWDAVSQGRRARHEAAGGRRLVRWEADTPEEGAYLMAGKWTEYARETAAVPAYVFLREPDPALAARYLDATERYVGMYAGLIGPYPYAKWALVENFWETGYGMPSFTVLGPKVVRLPFIVNTSYPHEILHSWWGGAVGIDYASGNWGEGLTAYLADHLLKEQAGQGAEHRQATLQKYADYVLGGRDLALAEFRSRHGSVSEAIGYGKSAMLFHMLRRDLGDDVFRAGLRAFYEANRFRTAKFADVRAAFERASGADLASFFKEWVERPGAPRLRLAGASAAPAGEGWRLEVRLAQDQGGEPYRLSVPVAITLEGRAAAEVRIARLGGREEGFSFDAPARPLRGDIDPELDLFRRLHREEIPPALSQAFGAERALIVLPAAAPPELRAAYERLAESLRRTGPAASIETAEDAAITELPADRSVWILGWENRLLPRVKGALEGYQAELGEQTVRLEQAAFPRRDHAVVVTARHPDNPDLALLWIGADRADALPGLARKLPHYHKYSYLGFSGAEAENVAKGRWPVVGSPLTAAVAGPDGIAPPLPPAGTLPKRVALAELPAAYSRERMLGTVRTLAAPEMEGRGFGAPGLERAAEYVARRFATAGLVPGGDAGTSYFQAFDASAGTPPRAARLRNVVGYIPGADPRFAGESVVVGAHYDHLGAGWPDVHAGDEGRLHPGADDNASGVAVLLELADVLGREWRPARTVVFAAFAGEEAGRLGSRAFLERGRFPAPACRGMINLDTVGRLGAGRLLVIGASSAPEWVHVFRGAGFLTGVDTVAAGPGTETAGDQLCFLEAGVPAVQLFTGPHPDYHRPSDLPEAIDADGLVKVAAVAKEALEYLATSERPLTPATGAGGAPSGPAAASGEGRKVSLGTVPDFSWQGEGVRLEGVSAGSPAEAAGLAAGDVVVGLAGKPVAGLKDLSAILKTLAPGDRVEIRYRRDGAESTAEAVLTAR